MKNFKSKTILSTFAILMVLSFTISMFALPGFVNAQTSDTKTYPFVDAIPNPIGVNQRTLINLGLLNFLNTATDGWNVTLTITDPSGHVTTVGPLKTWSTGTVGYSFVPTVAGNYTLKCTFDKTTYNNVNYSASETEMTLVVQDTPVATYPAQSMPTEYWTRPIDSQLREWWSVAGNWAYKPENLIAEANDAPTTAHILWGTPLGDTMGGLIGGTDTAYGNAGYQNGDAYEGKFAGSVIIGGILYYNKYVSGAPNQTIVALDLHTGEKLWENSYAFGGGRISTGQVLFWDSLNNRGGWSYIWLSASVGTNTTMYAVDAESGILRFNITNVPSGTTYFDSSGNMLKYSIVNQGNYTNPNYRLLQWNASSLPKLYGSGYTAASWGSQTQGKSFDGTRGYDLNVSIPAYNAATLNTTFPMASNVTFSTTIQKVFVGDKVILSNQNYSTVQLWAFSLTDGHQGALLYNTVNAAPAEWAQGNITISSIGQAGWAAWSQPDNVAIFFSKENRVHYAYSLSNGSYLWSTAPQVYADAWADTVLAGFGPDRVIAYGKLYSATVGGIVYCYDIHTGLLNWQYNVKDKYTESYITNNWWVIPLFVSGDKIYLGTLEHSALEPKPRGGPFLCLNATDGTLIFEADGLFRQTRWGGRAIIGDSIIATQDTYNQMIYAIGKGPSSVTVSTPDTAVTANTAVVIKGTVTDISPGTADSSITMRFPEGVPAVSDASQSQWMLYVYKQFSKPTNTTGVPVSIDAVDPNGNSVHIGTTVSDFSGKFAYEFTPTVAGTYTIYATFSGSGAYYGSYAENSLAVSAAPVPTATPTPIANPPYEMYTIGMGVAIIIAIAVVGLFLAKKHP
jgi:outer membrane protein assembly factor BamB